MTGNILLATALALTFHGAALASPTSAEFESCKVQAVQHLQQCLTGHGGGEVQISTCWRDSEAAFAGCRARVMASHARGGEHEAREQAEAAARARARAAE